jgi:predicted ATPase
MVFEDAHWINPTSRELLDLTVERVRGLPVLLIVTSRPEFHHTWANQPQVTMLMLNRLDRPDRVALVTQIAGRKALPDEVIDQIADRTDGVALFIEELTKSVLESGLLRDGGDCYLLDRALPPLAIPTSLHASLLARLDRLGSVRHLAQIGAAVGREFSYELLRAVSRIPEDELQANLSRLDASELVFQHGTPPDAVYSFKHALIREAAHGSLLRETRRRLHAQIAEALETHSPEMMGSQPAVFAQHYAEAGIVERSAAFWGTAGRRSGTRSAMAEAAAQFQKALDQLALLPNDSIRQRQELEFYGALGAALRAVKGVAAPETGHAYARARALWEQLGSPAEYLHVPYGQSRHYMIRGELDLSRRLDEDLLRLSRKRNDSGSLILGHLKTYVMLTSLPCPASIWKRRYGFMIHIHTACLPIRRDSIPWSYHGRFWGLSFCVSAFPTKRGSAAVQGSLRLGDWLIRHFWLRVCQTAPGWFLLSETTLSWMSGQTSWSL